MRTTINLEEDVLKKVRQRIRDSHQPAKKVYNELLRVALTLHKPAMGVRGGFRLITFGGKKGLMPGFSWEMSHSDILDKLDEEKWKDKK